ncbi:MAG: D-alanine--D-alanine ligase, partial [Deltaproteobacteria bacterium]
LVQQAAVKACRVLGCRGAARVDFMLREDGFYCIEVNTIPGMTATSLLPKAAQAAGVDFPQLVEMILLDADLDK